MRLGKITIARSLAVILVGAAAVAAPPADAFLFFGDDHACRAPAQPACGGCAVSCPIDRTPVCRAGIGIWHGKAWACLIRPACSCQKSIWSVR